MPTCDALKFSVIVPVYNVAGYVGRCLDSMSVAAGLSCLTDRQRRVAGRVARKRTRGSVRVNCLLPAWLRRKGLWRCP